MRRIKPHQRTKFFFFNHATLALWAFIAIIIMIFGCSLLAHIFLSDIDGYAGSLNLKTFFFGGAGIFIVTASIGARKLLGRIEISENDLLFYNVDDNVITSIYPVLCLAHFVSVCFLVQPPLVDMTSIQIRSLLLIIDIGVMMMCVCYPFIKRRNLSYAKRFSCSSILKYELTPKANRDQIHFILDDKSVYVSKLDKKSAKDMIEWLNVTCTQKS